MQPAKRKIANSPPPTEEPEPGHDIEHDRLLAANVICQCSAETDQKIQAEGDSADDGGELNCVHC